jgi:methylenetetrahydrofolate reductase (NADPH)
MQSQQHFSKVYSCEFFPPKTDKGMENLRNNSVQLKQEMNPEFFSVTYGAGGSEQNKTFEAVNQIKLASGISVAPHLTCIGSTKKQIKTILDDYIKQDINRIVALRGDIPDGASTGEFSYANELINFIRQETGDHFDLEVAAYPEFHPQADSAESDLNNFKRKVEAGATTAITQYFYNADAYFRFIESCEKLGIDIPIIPGIMPITNFTSLARFSNMCGAEIPRWIFKRLEGFGDDVESIKEFGADVVSEMSQKLIDAGAPGLHFYTLNQAEATLKIYKSLNL